MVFLPTLPKKVNARKTSSFNALETACLSISGRGSPCPRPLVRGYHCGFRFSTTPGAKRLALALQSCNSPRRDGLCRGVCLSTHGEAKEVTGANRDSSRSTPNRRFVSGCFSHCCLAFLSRTNTRSSRSTIDNRRLEYQLQLGFNVTKDQTKVGTLDACNSWLSKPQSNLFLHRLQRIDHELNMLVEFYVLFTDLTSMSSRLREGRTSAQATRKPHSSSVANRAFAMSVSRGTPV